MTTRKKHVLVLVGTRPEALKLAPVIDELKARSEFFQVSVCATGQHDELLNQVLSLFSIVPEQRLSVMTPGQTLPELTARLITAISGVLAQGTYDLVIVQGDTTTAFVGALCAFYAKIPVAHVEAGLRTHDMRAPFPEEMNRRLISHVATWHFAPTPLARQNLLREGTPADSIYVVGNTIVDALRKVAPHATPSTDAIARIAERPFLLVTQHRRESFGAPIKQVFRALAEFAVAHPEIAVVFPVHPNPNVSESALETLAGIANVHLIQPLPYSDFLYLMQRALFLVTDSGGIQEEAAALGKPILVTRETTERPEVLSLEFARLVGADGEALRRACEEFYAKWRAGAFTLSDQPCPFGDGRAAQYIADVLQRV